MDEDGENSSPHALDREASVPLRGGAEAGKGGPGHRERMLKVQRDGGSQEQTGVVGNHLLCPLWAHAPHLQTLWPLPSLPWHHISTEATFPLPPATPHCSQPSVLHYSQIWLLASPPPAGPPVLLLFGRTLVKLPSTASSSWLPRPSEIHPVST